MLSNTLLPKSILNNAAYTKLTGILLSIQKQWDGEIDDVRLAYDIDRSDESQLLIIMDSFSIRTVYDSLPPYYRGALVNDAGIPYNIPTKNRLDFMRKFVREMLRLRQDVGVIQMFDLVMGLLGITKDKYVVIQDYVFYNHVLDTSSVVERAVYYNNQSISRLAYQLAPNCAELFVVSGHDHYTPTQTITIDALTAQIDAIGDEFLRALKTIIYFLKPIHVIIKDIPLSIYLSTSGLYNMVETQRGVTTSGKFPHTLITGATATYDFSPLPYSGTLTLSAVATGNKLTLSSGTWKSLGMLSGMIIHLTGLTSNVVNWSFVDSINGADAILSTSDVILVNEGPSSATVTFDYDRSSQDGLMERVSPSTTSVKSGLKCVTENTSLPIWWESGGLADLSSGGSIQNVAGSVHDARYAGHHLDRLDSMRNEDLTPRIGGTIFFGFCETVAITFVAPNILRRSAGSWITDGFVVNGEISTSGFGSDISSARITLVSALDLSLDVLISNASILPGVICLESYNPFSITYSASGIGAVKIGVPKASGAGNSFGDIRVGSPKVSGIGIATGLGAIEIGSPTTVSGIGIAAGSGVIKIGSPTTVSASGSTSGLGSAKIGSFDVVGVGNAAGSGVIKIGSFDIIGVGIATGSGASKIGSFNIFGSSDILQDIYTGTDVYQDTYATGDTLVDNYY